MRSKIILASAALLVPLLTSGVAHAGAITPNPANYDFGDLGVGLTSVKTIYLENHTGLAATVQTIALTGADADSGEFALNAPGTPLTLVPNARIGVDVTFKPTGASGPRTTTLELVVKDEMDATTVPIAGNALGPRLSVSPSPIRIGGVKLGQQVTPVTITITNAGGGVLNVASVTPAGDDANKFALGNFTPQIPRALAGGETVVFEMAYAPVAKGQASIALHIVSDDPGSPVLDAPVLAWVGDPKVTVSLGRVILGNQNVGTDTPPVQVDINNAGYSDLNITDISLVGANPDDFAITRPNLPATLKVGSGTTISVHARPLGAGARNANVQIVSDDPMSPTLLPVSAFGTNPVGLAQPLALDYGPIKVQTNARRTFDISNNGDGPLVVQTLAVLPQGSFSLNAAAPFTIEPGQKKTVEVTFSPTRIQDYAAAANLTTDDPNLHMASITLTGSGVSPVLSVTPNKLDFGKLAVGQVSPPKSITVCNNGNAVMAVTALEINGFSGGLFKIVNAPPEVPFSLNPGECPKYQVQYTPANGGNDEAQLVINTDDPGNPEADVALTGSGAAASFETTPADGETIAFPQTIKGLTSKAIAIKVQNTGDADLKIASVKITMGEMEAPMPSDSFAVSLDAAAAGSPAVGAFAVPPQGSGNTGYQNLYVTFSPIDATARMHSIEITPDPSDPNLQSVHLALTGTGTDAQIDCVLSSLDTSIDFGQVTVGSASAPAALGIYNGGNASVPVYVVLDKGQLMADRSMASVPAMTTQKGSVKINVTFTPDAVGPLAGTLKVLLAPNATSAICAFPLKGQGVSGPVTGDGGDVPVARRSSCSIAGHGGSPDAVMLLLLLGVGLVARRRRTR